MRGFDQDRSLAALSLLVMALFVASGYPPAARWRGVLRRAALIGFGTALALALVDIALWAAEGGR